MLISVRSLGRTLFTTFSSGEIFPVAPTYKNMHCTVKIPASKNAENGMFRINL